MPDLSMSVLPLDVTSQSNQLSSLDHQPGIHEHQTTPLPDLANLHFRLIQFHSSISTLVQRHATLVCLCVGMNNAMLIHQYTGYRIGIQCMYLKDVL